MLAGATRGHVDRWLRPLAARLGGVAPGALTAAGLLAAAGGAASFALSDGHPAWFLAAAGLGLLWSVLDLLDGAVARLHGQESPWGDFADHASDRLASLLALGGLAWAEHSSDAPVLLLMVATLYQGYLGTQIQASFGRRSYEGMGMAESIAFTFLYCATAFGVRAAGLPFDFEAPLLGRRVTVTDAFVLAGLPIVALGCVQRVRLARRLAREGPLTPEG
jgi:phosphatidylglycerophosphate synthase